MNSSADIQLQNITKTFGTVRANSNINLTVKKGEIHALLGENGSGKSTLVNMLSGIYQPDGGEIFLYGKKTVFNSPKDAIAARIGMVHQHFKLVEVFSAKQNIVAGRGDQFFSNAKSLTDHIRQTSEKFGLHIDPDKKVYSMSVSEKQTVEILKVLYRGADILILDEPTAVLTPQEIKSLFDILRNMKKHGCAIIIITHKMNEVLEISDKVTVLRKGEAIATVDTDQTNAMQLTQMMVGRTISLDIRRTQMDESSKQTLLRVDQLIVEDRYGRNILDGVCFDLKSHEIMGVAGIAGSGQKELCESIAGITRPKSGRISLMGKSILGLSPLKIIQLGVSMSFVPEDRLETGLVGSMDIIDNVLLKNYKKTKGVMIDRKAGKQKAEQIVRVYDVSTPGVTHPVKNLSGGNIQKVLLGREIDLQPQVLITAYPVRGLDIGASYGIYDILDEQKQKGIGVLYIGEDLDVLLALCDRIMVLSHGRIMDIRPAENFTKEELGLMMLGQETADRKKAQTTSTKQENGGSDV